MKTHGLFLAALLANAVCMIQAALKDGRTYIIMRAADTTKVLFVENSSVADGATVLPWFDTRVPAQQWRARKNSDGTFSFKNVYTQKYLAFQGNDKRGSAKFAQLATVGDDTAWKVSVVANGKDVYTLVPSAEDLGRNAASSVEEWRFVEVSPAEMFTRAMRDETVAHWLRHHLRRRDGEGMTFGDGGGWGDAEMLEVLLDAYETSGNRMYLDIFAEVFGYFRKHVGDDWLRFVYNARYKWMGHDFNDDVMWMVIASVRMYHLTGESEYRTLAQKNFDDIYRRAHLKWGMLRWAEKSGNRNGTNSCINGPAEVAACYIAQSLDNAEERERYFETARNLYAQQRKYLFVEADGRVFDSFIWNADTDTPEHYNRWISTYNQGTMLGAAVMLYKHYGDEAYIRDADKIAACTRRHLCDERGIIRVCQTVDGDLCGFKGILMRYLRRYVVDLRHPELAKWLQDNAFFAYNNRNSHGITSSAWLTKSAEDWLSPHERDKNGNPKSFFNQPFGNSSAVSAAVNAPLCADAIVKPAFKDIAAVQFDYLRGISAVACDSGKKAYITNISDGFYTGYANVDFDSHQASKIRICVETDGTENTKIEVRLGTPYGRKIAEIPVPATKGRKKLTEKTDGVSGMQDVFLVYRIQGETSGLKILNFTFEPTRTKRN